MPTLSPCLLSPFPPLPGLTWAGKPANTPDPAGIPQHIHRERPLGYHVATGELQLQLIVVYLQGIQPSRAAQGHLEWVGGQCHMGSGLCLPLLLPHLALGISGLAFVPPAVPVPLALPT